MQYYVTTVNSPALSAKQAQPAASTGGDNPDGKLSVSAVDRRSAASQLEGLRCDGQTNKNKEKEEQKSEAGAESPLGGHGWCEFGRVVQRRRRQQVRS